MATSFLTYSCLLHLAIVIIAAQSDPTLKEVFDETKVTLYNNRGLTKGQNIQLSALDEENLKVFEFDPELPTIIFTHGYAGNHLGVAAQTVKNGYLNVSDANVILVDHKFYSFPYMRLFSFYKDIGKTVANSINFLISSGKLNLSKLTLVGHSFGAHISAIIANNINGRVERIIGLDPAGPHFHNAGPEDILSQDDAQEVRCIHTSPVLGISEPICHINYFVNGGADQPSCANNGENEVLFGTCSHNVVMEYLSRAINNPKAFPAAVCMTLSDAKNNHICSQAVGGYMEFPMEHRPYLPGNYYVPVP